ncbi:MAG: T9SS type A sorting domain-containing protein [Flavobacteriales bacterium]|nr:T9SS type A sorting domain-containing protein [Flavobacteriales bacterium]
MFLTTAQLLSQNFEWQQRASMPAPRWGAGTFVTTGLAFVVGGRSNGVDYPQMWAYDPIANSWTQKASFPGTPRRLATVFAANGKGYYGCGITSSSTYLSDFWEYDPLANSWVQKASFPGGTRYNTWQFVLNGIAYVGSGISTGASGPFLSDAFTYDPSSNAWTAATPIPDQGRHGAIGFAMGGKGYVVCGRENSLSFLQDFWSYNPATSSWSAMTPFSGAPRSSPLVFVYYNDAVVGCGRDGSTNHYDVWAFNPSLNSWSQIPSYPGATAMAGTSFSIGNRAFGGLGWDLASDLSHADLWELVKPGDVSIDEQVVESAVRVHPNPASADGVRITASEPGLVSINVLSGEGRLVQTWSFANAATVSTAELAPGIYFLHWLQGDAGGIMKLMIH